MDIRTSAKALGALAQEFRLNALRLLVRSGYEGLTTDVIERQLSTPDNTLSSSLSILSTAELMADCCQRQHNICSPVLDGLLPFCCASPDSPGEQYEKNAR